MDTQTRQEEVISTIKAKGLGDVYDGRVADIRPIMQRALEAANDPPALSFAIGELAGIVAGGDSPQTT